MATTYTRYFSLGGTTNQTLSRAFSLSAFAQSSTPEWTSGRADQLAGVFVKCSLSVNLNRSVNTNYVIESGGVRLETGNITKTMNAGSVYSGSAVMQIGDLTPAQVTAFVNGLSTATLTLYCSFNNGDATLVLYRKGGVEFSVSVTFVDMEGSSFSLDQNEYTEGDRPIVTVEPMETENELVHQVYWTIGDYIGERITLTSNRETLPAIPSSFAQFVQDGLSAPLVLHCITIENGVELGDRSITVTFTCADMIPTLTVTAEPTDGGTDYWQSFDGCKLTFNANPANSTNKHLTVSGDYSYDGEYITSLTIPTFTTSGVKTFSVEYTNGRNQMVRKTVNINVNGLVKPTISVFDAQRYERSTDDEGVTVYKWSITSGTVRVRYSFVIDSAGGNIRASDCSLKFKVGSNVVPVIVTALSGSVEYDNSSGTSADKAILRSVDFPASTDHAITMELSDGKNTVTAVVNVPKSRTNLHIAASDYGIGIGTFVEGTSADNPKFVCEYPAEFRNGIVGLEPKEILNDTDSYSNANGALVIHDVTITEAGWYYIHGIIEYSSYNAGLRAFEVVVNNETVIQFMIYPANGDATRTTGSWFGHLNAGDVLHWRTYQTSGRALTTDVHRRVHKLF